MNTKSKLTVFFDEPFWVGVYERVEDEKLEASRIVFGAEPKDYEIYEFLNENWMQIRFSPPILVEEAVEKRINPKRMKRQINKALNAKGIGTKAQQALKLQQEEGKIQRKHLSREKREEEEEKKFQIRQEKKKEKHKGR